jgi:hypothetical protein
MESTFVVHFIFVSYRDFVHGLSGSVWFSPVFLNCWQQKAVNMRKTFVVLTLRTVYTKEQKCFTGNCIYVWGGNEVVMPIRLNSVPSAVHTWPVLESAWNFINVHSVRIYFVRPLWHVCVGIVNNKWQKNINLSSTVFLLFYYTPIYLINTSSTTKWHGIFRIWQTEWHLKFRKDCLPEDLKVVINFRYCSCFGDRASEFPFPELGVRKKKLKRFKAL